MPAHFCPTINISAVGSVFHPRKNVQTHYRHFELKVKKVNDSDFGHFLGDGTKLKIPSEIKPTVLT